MKNKKIVAIAGSTGLIGNAVKKALEDYDVMQVTRKDFEMNDEVFVSKYENADILINYAGASIVTRWNRKNKKEIIESRVGTTRKMAEIAERGMKKERVFISGSAIGIYDDAALHDENSKQWGEGFMADLVKKWESPARKLSSEQTRVCVLRAGVVLSEEGGMIKRLEKPFRLGMGVIIGKGKQHFSFIHIDDLAGIVKHLIQHEGEKGIYNAVAPEVSTQKEFARKFASSMNRKVFMRIPEFVFKIIMGEAAVMLTGGQAVRTVRILESGYEYKFPTLDAALKDIVN